MAELTMGYFDILGIGEIIRHLCAYLNVPLKEENYDGFAE